MNHGHFLWHIGPRPEGCHHRPRLCLLKGCERPFWPRHRRSHFCSKACQQAARRWQRWQADQKYRATEQGRQRRQEQSRRHRQRRREREAASADVEPPRVGDHIQPDSKNSSGEPCQRPGCYELFTLPYERSRKRFCSVACRRALRRVIDREERYQTRRRRMRCERVQRQVQPPNTS